MFKNLKLLSKETDRQLKFNGVNDFSFAKEETICPLMLSEINVASRFFPIVFPVQGNMVPQALLSLQKGENRYVSDEGRWQVKYVPLHLRRYPFVLGQKDAESPLLVMYDADAPQFKDNNGKALFEERNDQTVATPLLDEIQKYLAGLNSEFKKTKDFFNRLKEKNVLKPSQITLTDKEGKEHKVRGFATVDWNEVKKLDDATLAQWTRDGLIQMIHMHLLSLESLKSSR